MIASGNRAAVGDCRVPGDREEREGRDTREERELREAFGKRILAIRQDRNESQETFAEFLSVSQPFIAQIENATRGLRERAIGPANARKQKSALLPPIATCNYC